MIGVGDDGVTFSSCCLPELGVDLRKRSRVCRPVRTGGSSNNKLDLLFFLSLDEPLARMNETDFDYCI